jgi:RHS repeat-associated protein
MSLDGSSLAAYGYDDANRLTSVVHGAQTTRLGYDGAGRPDSVTLPNGIERSTTYDVASQVTRLSYTLGSTSLGDLQYAYDDAGRRVATWGTLARFRLPDVMRSATYDDANRRTAQDGATLAWDDNGNLTDDDTNTYSWNSRNQLTDIRDRSGTIASFTYDPLGRRAGATIAGSSRSCVYDGWNVVKEDGSTADAILVNGLGLDQAFARTVDSTTSSVLADALGSTIALADERGAITDEFAYGPFGESDTTVDHPFQYTGRENDGTGLYQYRNRYYSPAMKRFISEDPTGMAGSGTNYYAYADNDPLGYTDPLGLSSGWSPQIPMPSDVIGWVGDQVAPSSGYNSFNIDGHLGGGLGLSFQVSCHGKFSVGINVGAGIGASVSATHQTGSPTPTMSFNDLSIVGGGTAGFASGNASVSPSDGSGGVGYGLGFGGSASIGLAGTVGTKDNGC